MFGLLQKHKEAMSEDYRRNNQSTFMVEQMVLMDIQKLLQSMQKDIKMYPLPDIDDTYDVSHSLMIFLQRFLRRLALRLTRMMWLVKHP